MAASRIARIVSATVNRIGSPAHRPVKPIPQSPLQAGGSGGVCALCLTPAAICLLIILSGCSRQPEANSEIVAQVGDRSLTRADLSKWEAALPQGEVTPQARSSLVQKWVEEEVLYQAALEKGLQNDPWVKERMDQLSRSLLTARYLDLEPSRPKPPSLATVQSYFQTHGSEFVWPGLNFEVEFWRSGDRGALERLGSDLQRGRTPGTWSNPGGQPENSTVTLDERSTSPEIWRVVSGMRTGQVSALVSAQNSFWIFRILDRREAGQSQMLEDVSDDISARLIEENQRRQRDELVRSLTDRYRRSGKLRWLKELPITTPHDSAAATPGEE